MNNLYISNSGINLADVEKCLLLEGTDSSKEMAVELAKASLPMIVVSQEEFKKSMNLDSCFDDCLKAIAAPPGWGYWLNVGTISLKKSTKSKEGTEPYLFSSWVRPLGDRAFSIVLFGSPETGKNKGTIGLPYFQYLVTDAPTDVIAEALDEGIPFVYSGQAKHTLMKNVHAVPFVMNLWKAIFDHYGKEKFMEYLQFDSNELLLALDTTFSLLQWMGKNSDNMLPICV